MADLNTRISDFVWKNLNEKHVAGKKDSFWKSLENTGTELWLDTGDIAEAESAWQGEMNTLTHNIYHLNSEIQKGHYDVFIQEAKSVVRDLPFDERIREIAFIVNARHGLRLANKFGAFVSIGLHTDLVHDINAIERYAKRYHEICPDKFIIKVPLTAEGLIAARRLQDSGVRINFTLEFSARQNVLVTKIVRPDYVNIFVGRINDYIFYNKLGDGSGAGEMAAISSQNWVTALSSENTWQTRLVAASFRNYKHLELLAGTDIFTMPPEVVIEGRKKLPGIFSSRMHENYDVKLYDSAEGACIEKFWSVSDKVLRLADRLSKKLPASGTELIHIANEESCQDLFPVLGKAEKSILELDGKIPVHARWENKIKEDKIAPDSLLTLAGLASFSSDQKQLDARIRSIIG